MNKSLWLGLGIFFTIILGLLSVSISADVNAQSITTADSNINVSTIVYELNISELNLSDSINIWDNETNTTITVNVTNTVMYDCELNTSDGFYFGGANSGMTTITNDIITVNQTLAMTLSEGYHDLALGCEYTINTVGYTNTSTYEFNQTINKTIFKTILVDTLPPIIVLENQSTTLSNGTAWLNFTLQDISTMNCVMSVANITTSLTTNTSNIIVPINLSAGNYTYTVSCVDALNNTNTANAVIQLINNISNNTTEIPFFNIVISEPSFSLGELGYYTINATNNSNVSITICPVASGWVQCFMTPPFINDTFPKTQALPYTNKTGTYLIEGVMRYKNYTITRNVTYETVNTLTATITTSDSTILMGERITFNATASSGIGAYTYRWTMHDNTKFTGPGAYKNYTTPGMFRVNLTVNDSVGNNYSTYVDVTVRQAYTLTAIVQDIRNNARIKHAEVIIDNSRRDVDTNGVATFRLAQDDYDIRVVAENYSTYTTDIELDADRTIYLNMTFQDLIPPTITLLTANDLVLTKETVDLKFKAEDISKVNCSLYIADANSSWYTLKDAGGDLLSNTIYTFEIRDLDGGAYKWKIECVDSSSNKIYSEERQFIVSGGDVTVALQSNNQNYDNINLALDNMNKLSGEESAVADILNMKEDLKDLLNEINNLDRNIHDLAYRRDLDAKGIEEAQKNLAESIEYKKYNIPMTLSIVDSKTFVKYVHDEDLKSILDEYSTLKNLKLDKRLFLESTKRAQSRVIVSTRVRNVELYYLDGEIREITLVTKDIQAAVPEEDGIIKNSNTITFLEVIPKTISQTVKDINILNKEFTVVKDDPVLEFPADTREIIYYINGTVRLDEFENTDTLLIDKNIDVEKSITGFSVLGINSISDIKIEGQGIMIIIIVLLILFYIVINFDLIDKIRNLDIGFVGFGSKKKISFIRVLVNDALDYLKSEDYDKATMVYREIKLSYEEANTYVKKQVYDESFDLCNQLDLAYALTVLDKAEYYLNINDRNNAMIEFEKLEKTYNKLDESYQSKIDVRFKKVFETIKRLV